MSEIGPQLLQKRSGRIGWVFSFNLMIKPPRKAASLTRSTTGPDHDNAFTGRPVLCEESARVSIRTRHENRRLPPGQTDWLVVGVR